MFRILFISVNIDWWVQKRRNSSADALELRLFYTDKSMLSVLRTTLNQAILSYLIALTDTVKYLNLSYTILK